ncbi:hypothetical protein [Streptomyces avidinii]
MPLSVKVPSWPTSFGCAPMVPDAGKSAEATVAVGGVRSTRKKHHSLSALVRKPSVLRACQPYWWPSIS